MVQMDVRCRQYHRPRPVLDLSDFLCQIWDVMVIDQSAYPPRACWKRSFRKGADTLHQIADSPAALGAASVNGGRA
jgi:hypothetical protein